MSYLNMLKSTYKLVTKVKTYFLTQIYQFTISMISSLIMFTFTLNRVSTFSKLTFSNVNEKDGSNFSCMLCFGYFYYIIYININIIYWSFVSIIFLGILRDMSMPTTSPSFSTLSSSQNRAFQYICQIMSKMDSIPNDYVDQEIGDIEQYSVSQTIV